MSQIIHKTLVLPNRSTQVEISIGTGLLENDIRSYCRLFSGRIAIISDCSISETYGKSLQKALGAELLVFEGGEKAKTRENKQRFEDILLSKKFGRDTLLIGLGGGVVTDFTAFLASSYMRQIPFILIPTTLLAMVDAAIGGKCGVDTPFGKNLIGSIYHPTHIFVDPSLLESLPLAQWTYGLAEIMKYGLIYDEKIWDLIEKNSSDWKKSVLSLIVSSIEIKKTIVEQDPLETLGIRRILNFGHTMGHALELLSKYEIPHGEAVAIGCLIESAISHELGLLDLRSLKKIDSLFRKFPFRLEIPSYITTEAISDVLDLDKKSLGGVARFVLIDRIGHAVPFDGSYCRPVSRTVWEPILHRSALYQSH